MTFALPQNESDLVFTIGGLVLLLFGWLIFRLSSHLVSVALGAGFGFFFGEVLNVVLEVDRNTGLYITIGCAMVGALAAMYMIKAVTNFLFALIGFLFGALLGRLAADIYLDQQQIEFSFNSQTGMIILGTAGGMAIMAVWLQRLIMIFITCYMGATFLVAGVDYLSEQPWAFPVVLGVGVFWQGFVLGRIFKTRRRVDKPKTNE